MLAARPLASQPLTASHGASPTVNAKPVSKLVQTGHTTRGPSHR